MLAHVQVFCFLASYSVALVLEASRLVFQSSSVRRMATLGFVAAGWVAHTAFLYNSAVADGGTPLSSYRDWMLLAAWALVLVYFYLACFHPTTHFGIVFLPLVLGLIVAAHWFADPKPFAREPASKIWGAIHGTSILAATVSVLFGFAAGVMYLWQAQRLKHKGPPRFAMRLPSLEWLQKANFRALVASTLLVGVAVASGIELNRLRDTPGLPWYDPLVLGTLAMFAWLVLHVTIAALYRPIRQGRKVAYLTLVGFVFLVIALALAGRH